jgi:hypothetical protein
MQNKLDTLIKEILKIKGSKIATLITNYDNFVVDIDEKGNFGYQEGVKNLFEAKLLRAMHEGGGLIIREFLPIKTKRKMPNGKIMWIPEKMIYGVAFGNKMWKGLKAEMVKKFHQTDHKTGKPISLEEGVRFGDFPIGSS